MRHFLRVDGGCSIGPSMAGFLSVEHGETVHLDENIEDEAQVAEDISRHSSGWIEVDDSGTAISTGGEVDRTMPDERRHRFFEATPTVSELGESPQEINVEPVPAPPDVPDNPDLVV
jgi:hypothetical protein